MEIETVISSNFTSMEGCTRKELMLKVNWKGLLFIILKMGRNNVMCSARRGYLLES
jgi:hypothetical protein